MNLRGSRLRQREKIVRLEMTPMIDCIFLLLIFFLVSTTYAPPESQLTPALQAEFEGGRASDFEPQILEIALVGARPAYRIGERVIRERAELVGVLRGLPKEGGIFVKGAGEVTIDWAAAALQSCRDAGFEKVTYVPAP